MNILKTLIDKARMSINPHKYAKRIGVNICDSTILLGKSNWGSEPWLIKIGKHTRISKDVTFWTHDGGISSVRRLDEKYKDVVKFGFIEIGDNCFIGANTTILCNVTIGDNCVIGACSLVTKNIPSGQVWGGNPAKFICTIEEYANKLSTLVPSYDADNLKNNKQEETKKIAETYRRNKK